MGDVQDPGCSNTKKPSFLSRDIDIDPIIALIDMDCFYVQVELRLEPEFRGKPAGVTQYLTRYKGGGLIAVNYEARAHGVKRGCRAVEAKEICPDFKVFSVPELNGKADLTRYREAGSEVIQVMNRHFSVVERASIDEAFVDLTGEVKALLPKYLSGELSLTPDELRTTCVFGWQSLETWLDHHTLKQQQGRSGSTEEARADLNNLALGIGAKMINELRGHVLEETQFHCSAGISYSKTLSKLACGMNKPQKQTVLAGDRVMELFEKTKIQDIRFLGGKLGEQIVSYLGITFMAELCRIPPERLLRFFEPKTAEWLKNLAKGWDDEMVKQRQLPKSIGCSKNFLGRLALRKRQEIKHWMLQFSQELSQRLKKDQFDNGRTATLLTAHMTILEKGEKKGLSRCCPLSSYEVPHLAQDGFNTADKHLSALGFQNGFYVFPVVSLGIVASKIKDGRDTSSHRIDSYFTEIKKPADVHAGSPSVSPDKRRKPPDRIPHIRSPSDLKGNSRLTVEAREKGIFLLPQANQDDADFGDDEENELDEYEALNLLVEGLEPEREGTPVLFGDEDEEAGDPTGNRLDEPLPEDAHPEKHALSEETDTVSGNPRPSTSKTSEIDGEVGEVRNDSGVPASTSDESIESWNFRSYQCKKCRKVVWCPMLEQEHTDYHLALELSQTGDPGVPRKKLKLDDVVVERKPKKTVSSSSLPSKSQGLTLDHFFKKGGS